LIGLRSLFGCHLHRSQCDSESLLQLQHLSLQCLDFPVWLIGTQNAP
jgi:hypothetical protein